MAKTAKHAKKKLRHRHPFRNDMRPTRAPSARVATSKEESRGKKSLSHGQATLYNAGGAAIATTTCALVARQNILPATFVTGLVTAIGGTAAAISESPTVRALGRLAMAEVVAQAA